MSDTERDPTRAGVAPASTLAFVREHPALASTALAVTGLTAAAFFLIGYATSFDGQLIWLVEYPDILKFGLIGMAVAGGWLITAWNYGSQIVADRNRGRAFKWMGLIVPALFGLTLLWELWWAYVEGFEKREATVWAFATLFFVIVATYMLVDLYQRHQGVPDVGYIVVLAIAVAVGCSLAGIANGARVRHQNSEYTVFLEGEKDGQRTITGAKLVMMTSRFAVFYLDRKTIVVPIEAVRRIERWK
jgi:hypothetical protein